MPISGLRLSAKFAGSGVWHTGQARIPVGVPQSGHGAVRAGIGLRDSGGGNVGSESELYPVSRCRTSSRVRLHRSRPGEARPVHWNRSLLPSIRW